MKSEIKTVGLGAIISIGLGIAAGIAFFFALPITIPIAIVIGGAIGIGSAGAYAAGVLTKGATAKCDIKEEVARKFEKEALAGTIEQEDVKEKFTNKDNAFNAEKEKAEFETLKKELQALEQKIDSKMELMQIDIIDLKGRSEPQPKTSSTEKTPTMSSQPSKTQAALAANAGLFSNTNSQQSEMSPQNIPEDGSVRKRRTDLKIT